VLLPGSAGWRPIYATVARELADSGFVALALDYYGETGRDTSRGDRALKWPLWQGAVRAAVAWVAAHPDVAGRPVALVGYSRGAYLAVSVAASLPEVGAVVDFYGGGGGGPDSLADEVRGFPPLLILHGEADSVVPVRHALRLRDAVLAAGGQVEMHLYAGAQHAFNGGYASTHSEVAAADSWRRTLAFLRARLPGSLRARPDSPAPDVEQIRTIHRRLIAAHLAGDVRGVLEAEAETLRVVSRGEVRLVTRAERVQDFTSYLRSTTFSHYRDLIEPAVRVSADGTLGWLIARVEITGSRMDRHGARSPFSDVWAWVELYEKREGRWIRVGEVSNVAPVAGARR